MPELELQNGYYKLPPGKLANVATRMEMKSRPARSLLAFPKDLQLEPAPRSDLASYRQLFRDVGQEYLWFSRLIMPDEKLKDTLANPGTESFTLKQGGKTLGILELNFRDMPDCELAFFGLVPEAIGNGLGKLLLDEAIRRAFAKPISRFWLSTCTLDHPRAISFYAKAGFKPYARFVELHDDPRHQGHLPVSAASQIPLID